MNRATGYGYYADEFARDARNYGAKYKNADQASRKERRNVKKRRRKTKKVPDRASLMRTRRIKRTLLFGGIVLAAMLVSLWLIYNFVFVVTSVKLDGTTMYTKEDITDAADITEGETRLYSFRSSTVREHVTLSCPYISELSLVRQVPDSVLISVSEDTAMYYTDVYGENKLLSSGLRVLETVEDGSEKLACIVKIKLPEVKYAVAGRVIELRTAKYERAIREVLSTIADWELADRVTMVDMRDPYDIAIVVDGKARLIIGNTENIDVKFRNALEILKSEIFSTDNRVRVDLTTPGKNGVLIDNHIEVE